MNFYGPRVFGRRACLMDWLRRLALILLLTSSMALLGCASGPRSHPADPLEPFNRTMFEFNDALDRAIVKPVATGYQQVVPELARKGVGNFFNNLQDVWSVVNNLLQFKAEGAASSFMRVLVNTTAGLAGILDVASEINLERYTEDFGQTLGYWGVSPGPYIVLPVLGPSTLRDTVALPVDWRGDLVNRQEDVAVRNSLWALRVLDNRARLLRLGDMLEDAALDKYTFVRDAHLQRRRNLVYDGNPPEETEANGLSSDGQAPR